MSYYQGGQYQQQQQQPPPQSSPQQQGYQYAYDDYQQPAQNGGQYAQQQPPPLPPRESHPYQSLSLAGYGQYQSGGGPVQQPQAAGYAYQQEPYHSPRSTSFSYTQQPAYAQQYNPQDYAQPMQVSLITRFSSNMPVSKLVASSVERHVGERLSFLPLPGLRQSFPPHLYHNSTTSRSD